MQAHRLGAHAERGGVEFRLWAPHAERIELLLFDSVADLEPQRTLELQPLPPEQDEVDNGGVWSCFWAGGQAGQLYGYRVHGPRELGFDPDKLLLDPWARLVVPSGRPARASAERSGSNLSTAPKAMVSEPTGTFDWQGDRPPRTPLASSVIYEAHLRGLTAHPSSGVSRPLAGTFRGLIERLDHLGRLGVTALELLPIQAFDAEDAAPGCSNYWGYSPLAWFAPHPSYAASVEPLDSLDELRSLVRAAHQRGIEVWMDVVFNHTSEGGPSGPVWNWRGLAERECYLRKPSGESDEYLDVTGCGNTFHTAHPFLSQMIVECLAYWVTELHIDGFRFDLAATLTRGSDGEVQEDPPLIRAIEEDPRLRGVRLIAEAWDVGGLYQVGHFPGRGWIDWNDRFRDDVRRYLKGDPDTLDTLCDRLEGSRDVYGDRSPGVHYVTCHDGFTLEDLVSYERKHNLANGEDNRDGSDRNHSCNHGVEGPTDDPRIEDLRALQVRNALLLNLLTPGPAMLLMGDEMRRTQGGNNNGYAQDNEVSWLNWQLAKNHDGLVNQVREWIRLRKRLAPLRGVSEATTRRQVDEELGTALLEERREGLCLLWVLNRSSEVRHIDLSFSSTGQGDWEVLACTGADAAPRKVGDGSTFDRPPRSVALLGWAESPLRSS